jgi:DNA-binding response OmpR family regulator
MNALNKPVVMVIDPDALTLTAIAAMLDCAQFEVYCAQDRAAAIKGATTLNLDLIVCDEDIDDSHGASLVTQLRHLPNRQDVPIMYMSERQLPDIISRPHDGGAAYHIKKPLDPRQLLEKINLALVELPLVNQQVRQKLHQAPHFAVPVIASIPNVAQYTQ